MFRKEAISWKRGFYSCPDSLVQRIELIYNGADLDKTKNRHFSACVKFRISFSFLEDNYSIVVTCSIHIFKSRYKTHKLLISQFRFVINKIETQLPEFHYAQENSKLYAA